MGEIIALIDVSVSQFGGKSLNASNHCKLIQNLQDEKYNELKQWVQSHDHSTINSVTEQREKTEKRPTADLTLIAEVQDQAEQDMYSTE